MMEALWVHQWHNVVNVELLSRMLASPEANARAAAGRVLCYWRDRVPDALARFAKLAEDENPRVRLEAVRAASFYRTAAAADVALAALKRPLDYYLEYCLKETLRQLEPYWRKAIAAGQPVAKDNAAGLGYLLKSLNTAEVMKLPASNPSSPTCSAARESRMPTAPPRSMTSPRCARRAAPACCSGCSKIRVPAPRTRPAASPACCLPRRPRN